MEKEKHWDNIFANESEEILGWFEKDFSQTLKFLEKIENLNEKDIFISGVGVSKIAELLAKRDAKTILNDISQNALDTLKQRISNAKVEYFLHDISKPFEKKCDLWMDRAVLHFLIKEEDIKTYFESLKRSVNKNGFVLFAQYFKGSATKCANLPLHQYSLEEFSLRLGDDFILLDSENIEYINPFNEKRDFIYALYKRI